MIIDDIVAEVAKIQDSMNAIKEALKTKGVTSQGKLNKFAEEIKSITAAAPINEAILTAINNMLNFGFKEEEVVTAINNYIKTRAKLDLTTTSISNNEFRNKKDLIPIQVYFRLESIGMGAFSYSNLQKLTAPLVKKIAINAFQSCGSLEELNLGSYNYGPENKFLLHGCPNMKKLVVGDNSVITQGDYSTRLSNSSKDIEIYTYSGKKYNKNTYRFE
jgi:hypothetical protein